MGNAEVPDAQKVLWNDLVQGKPELDDSLSTNAKAMKADLYMKTFKDATDLDHSCRVPGVTYLRCLTDNTKEKSKTRQISACLTSQISTPAAKASCSSRR